MLSDIIQSNIRDLERIPLTVQSRYLHWFNPDEQLGITVLKVRGNGLCWINSLIVSIFGEFWNKPAILNNWLLNLYSTLTIADNDFIPYFDLYNMRIKYGTTNLCDFLDSNNELQHAISHNLIAFCVRNYMNPDINVGCLRPVELNVCVGYNAKMKRIFAIDCNMRNFIMNILGIKKAIIYQHKIGPENMRHTDKINGVTQIMKGDKYIGFQIHSFGTINIGGYIGSVVLYSFDLLHYDAICVNHEGIAKLGLFRDE